jgi:acetyl esterase/lipase
MWDDDLDQVIARVGIDRVRERFSKQPGYEMFDSLDAYLNYWPFRHIRAAMPPFLFLIAESEQINPPILQTNRAFVEKAKALGDPAEFQIMADRTHYSAIHKFSEKGDPAFEMVRNFVRKKILENKN